MNNSEYKNTSISPNSFSLMNMSGGPESSFLVPHSDPAMVRPWNDREARDDIKEHFKKFDNAVPGPIEMLADPTLEDEYGQIMDDDQDQDQESFGSPSVSNEVTNKHISESVKPQKDQDNVIVQLGEHEQPIIPNEVSTVDNNAGMLSGFARELSAIDKSLRNIKSSEGFNSEKNPSRHDIAHRNSSQSLPEQASIPPKTTESIKHEFQRALDLISTPRKSLSELFSTKPNLDAEFENLLARKAENYLAELTAITGLEDEIDVDEFSSDLESDGSFYQKQDDIRSVIANGYDNDEANVVNDTVPSGQGGTAKFLPSPHGVSNANIESNRNISDDTAQNSQLQKKLTNECADASKNNKELESMDQNEPNESIDKSRRQYAQIKLLDEEIRKVEDEFGENLKAESQVENAQESPEIPALEALARKQSSTSNGSRPISHDDKMHFSTVQAEIEKLEYENIEANKRIEQLENLVRKLMGGPTSVLMNNNAESKQSTLNGSGDNSEKSKEIINGGNSYNPDTMNEISKMRAEISLLKKRLDYAHRVSVQAEEERDRSVLKLEKMERIAGKLRRKLDRVLSSMEYDVGGAYFDGVGDFTEYRSNRRRAHRPNVMTHHKDTSVPRRSRILPLDEDFDKFRQPEYAHEKRRNWFGEK